jgi:hypothetical protein
MKNILILHFVLVCFVSCDNSELHDVSGYQPYPKEYWGVWKRNSSSEIWNISEYSIMIDGSNISKDVTLGQKSPDVIEVTENGNYSSIQKYELHRIAEEVTIPQSPGTSTAYTLTISGFSGTSGTVYACSDNPLTTSSVVSYADGIGTVNSSGVVTWSAEPSSGYRYVVIYYNSIYYKYSSYVTFPFSTNQTLLWSSFSEITSSSTSIEPGLYKGASYETAALIGTQTLENALTYIYSNAVSGDNYYIVLGADVTMAAKTLSYSGKTVSITLRGYGAERQINLSGTGALFTVSGSSGNEVTLLLDNNISLKGVASNTSALVVINSYGKLIMKNSSKIFGNNNTGGAGGGVSLEGGTFTMSGGTINGNTASSSSNNAYGGGVFWDASASTFTMTGGTISGNTASSTTAVATGGGVWSGGRFTMSGGTISGNTASSSSSPKGGGVFAAGIFTMSGGTISGNTASSSSDAVGGGVCAAGTFSMSGGTISGNTASADADAFGGGVCLSGVTFIMSGGTISGNTASAETAYGGGVCTMPGGAFTKSGNSIIYGNDADASLKNTTSGSNGRHAVYVFNGSKKRNTTAGASVALDSSLSGSAGGWE